MLLRFSDLCTVISMVWYRPKNCHSIKLGCSLTESVYNSLLGIVLVRFCLHLKIYTLFHAFFAHRMDKTSKLSKKLPIFLLISFQFCTKKLLFSFLNPKKSISNYGCDTIKFSCPKTLVCKSFLDIFCNPDHCALTREYKFKCSFRFFLPNCTMMYTWHTAAAQCLLPDAHLPFKQFIERFGIIKMEHHLLLHSFVKIYNPT